MYSKENMDLMKTSVLAANEHHFLSLVLNCAKFKNGVHKIWKFNTNFNYNRKWSRLDLKKKQCLFRIIWPITKTAPFSYHSCLKNYSNKNGSIKNECIARWGSAITICVTGGFIRRATLGTRYFYISHILLLSLLEIR